MPEASATTMDIQATFELTTKTGAISTTRGLLSNIRSIPDRDTLTIEIVRALEVSGH